MPRYALTIEYTGSPYNGWQIQPWQRTVQGALQQALCQFCQHNVTAFAAGRTDAGVHALGQVAHVDLARDYRPDVVMRAVNFYLLQAGEDIAVLDCHAVSSNFHARFSATARHYRYHIINRRAPLTVQKGRVWHVIPPLDTDLMQQAADRLVGNHDFSSFRDKNCQAKSPVKTLDYLTVTRSKEHVTISSGAPSFLHHQMRIITGTLVDIGRGYTPLSALEGMLNARRRDAAGVTAPPEGLFLTKVDYT